MATRITRKSVAEKNFKAQYITLWRWEREGVPPGKVAFVDRVLCRLEGVAPGGIADYRKKAMREQELLSPNGITKRLSKLFPGLWKNK